MWVLGYRPTVAWILSRVGPTIRRGHRLVSYIILYDCGRVYIPRLLDVVVNLICCLVHKLSERTVSPHSFLLPIVVDCRSRGIARTDPIPKPGVSSTLPSKKREML